MVCSACRRRVDTSRSFCRACGSSVFTDDADFRGPRVERAVEQRVDAPVARRRLERLTSAERPPWAGPSTTSRLARPAGCLAALVRLLIFGAIVWYVGKWLLAIPEVRALVNAFTSGALTDDQLNAAGTAIRGRLLQLLGGN